MKNIVYFDLETRRSASQVGGWHETDKMGISVAVTFSTASNSYSIYTQDEAAELVEQLRCADLVVGYNHLGFDYGVLQPFTFWTIGEVTRNLDLCLDLSERLGHRLRLDSVARPTLCGKTKTADGTDALKWWAEYERSSDPEKLVDIATYCCFDVKVTMAVHQFGVKNGYVLYENRVGSNQKIPVDWGDDRKD